MWNQWKEEMKEEEIAMKCPKLQPEDFSTIGANAYLGRVEKNTLAAYFSTLTTALESRQAGIDLSCNSLNINGLAVYPQVPRDPQRILSESRPYLPLVFTWLAIALDEGHVEPSQPCVGRIVGWPIRPFYKKSLYIDFALWCCKKGVTETDTPAKMIFCAVTDQIFDCIDDEYHFPALEECRMRFKEMRRLHETT